MKVTAFVGSARKRHTYKATEQFLYNLQLIGDIEYEIVALNEYHIEVCKGCKLCLDKGEELCPLKDDRDKLIEKMNNSDGIQDICTLQLMIGLHKANILEPVLVHSQRVS